MQPFSTLPQSLKELITGYTWNQVTIGESGAKVFCLKRNHHPTYYLKMAHKLPRRDLLEENSVLRWLRNKLPVPEVIHFAEDDNRDYILLSEMPGTNAVDSAAKVNKTGLVKLLARGLRMIHEISIDDCPFDRSLKVEMKIAEDNVKNSLLEDGDFDDVRIGLYSQTLYEELILKKPEKEDLVFTHGDYCLPNIIILGNSISGFVDLHRAGISDRYKDFADVVASIKRNLGPGLEPIFFDEYGILEPDREKIEYYTVLAEFL
ncbi:MAG: aminoglycoside 3'-phosphotransferase [Chloroflexi bacterium]|nr:aminoglycoside 3'-phosphotransferase [Chloroflexota bacterium]